MNIAVQSMVFSEPVSR